MQMSLKLVCLFFPLLASPLSSPFPPAFSLSQGIDYAEVENEGPLIYLNASHDETSPLAIHQTVR